MNAHQCPICGAHVAELVHYKGTPGDYCHGCAPAFKPKPVDPFAEEVNGIVVGEILTRFEFWTTDNTKLIARYSCENQDEAIQKFKEERPDRFAAGATLRIYD